MTLRVVFGTGPVGQAVTRERLRHSHQVRAVSRGERATLPVGVEHLTGDASDPGFAGRACRGAQVVYNPLNPPYHAGPIGRLGCPCNGDAWGADATGCPFWLAIRYTNQNARLPADLRSVPTYAYPVYEIVARSGAAGWPGAAPRPAARSTRSGISDRGYRLCRESLRAD